jgi:hypothetical protein
MPLPLLPVINLPCSLQRGRSLARYPLLTWTDRAVSLQELLKERFMITSLLSPSLRIAVLALPLAMFGCTVTETVKNFLSSTSPGTWYTQDGLPKARAQTRYLHGAQHGESQDRPGQRSRRVFGGTEHPSASTSTTRDRIFCPGTTALHRRGPRRSSWYESNIDPFISPVARRSPIQRVKPITQRASAILPTACCCAHAPPRTRYGRRRNHTAGNSRPAGPLYGAERPAEGPA